ncbi:HpcH/HpaI aldolase/citrate lyase family protein [Streptomyces sp. VB1]|uniref:HpcH/HpaI aldolase/citrate lyase family protein n=1 Tax=Streptomyces sp. VB1 TaxID=2986803 RepID=UPI0022419CD4|nr:CoA ester lyase [Streptomyces sp. VB1]UZI32377.1 CoA ester lyase [Streptomyces sp. VB1]
MTSNWLRRKPWIITPALSPDRFGGAQTAGADYALVDFEDSVPPVKKQEARDSAQEFFQPAEPRECTLGVRMNSPFTQEGIRDLVALSEYAHKPEVILIPKTESARDIELVASVLDNDDYSPQLFALIETPRAIADIASIARAERLHGVIFGAADYAAIVGCGMDWDSLLYARSAMVNAAHLAQIMAVDSPYFDMTDLDGLRREAERAKNLGYWTKGAVHPRQVPVISEVFEPTEKEVADARAILAASQESGNGITSVMGRMVGTPFFNAARTLIERVDRVG